MNISVHELPAINATLNALATVLLVAGLALIKAHRETAHKLCMYAAFLVSTVFLVSYLIYHYTAGHVPFTGPQPIKTIYLLILFTHIVLAVTVPVLAITTIVLGIRDRRAAHRRWAKWTFPIWLYVSVTGVVIYVLLYQLYPAATATAIIQTL